MIVLVHENHDKWPNVTPVQHFAVVFRGSKYLPKIRFSYVYFFDYDHLKRFV